MSKYIHITLIVLVGIILMNFNNRTINKAKNPLPVTDEMFEPIVVLELFTSQGCSSCPSADVLLQKVKKEFHKEVFALSYHVDYWNYIGWKDPFSKSSYAKKQGIYNIKFRNKSNYTPQLVVNGKEHFVGSNTIKMYDYIDTFKNQRSLNQVRLSKVEVSATNISFNYKLQGALKDKKIRAVLALDERSTDVKRGENRSRTLINSNIVVGELVIDIDQDSGTVDMVIPKIVKLNEHLNLIVLIENDNYDITAAAKHSIKL